MNIFIYELKKIWNWRILIIIGLMGILVWFAFLHDSFRSYDSLTTHGIYGSYQMEMFELYGNTISPDELALYDIPGKKASAIEELNEIIATGSIFSENNISNYGEYEKFYDDVYSRELSAEEEDKLRELTATMQKELVESTAQTLDELYASPLTKLQSLAALERTYVNFEDSLRSYIDFDSRSVVVQTAKDLLKMNNANLIRYDLTSNFSFYVMIVGVFSMIAVTVFIAPFLITDRMWGVYFLQYSATIGRRIFKTQFAVTILSTVILSMLLIVLAYIPFMVIGGFDFWNAPIMSYHPTSMQLYNITFGQYALILAGIVLLLNISVASFTFVLARFSQNIIVMMMKAVPLCVAIAGIMILAVNEAFSEQNIVFTIFFQGKIQAPEIIVTTFISIIGFVIASYITKREKHVDV